MFEYNTQNNLVSKEKGFYIQPKTSLIQKGRETLFEVSNQK